MQVAVRANKVPVSAAQSQGYPAPRNTTQSNKLPAIFFVPSYNTSSVLPLQTLWFSYALSQLLQSSMKSWTHLTHTWTQFLCTRRQIGRSTESPIDFVVTDTVAGSQSNSDTQSVQSTISRFACRIMCQRTPPYTARIYAAGFDSSKNIFLGVSAVSSSHASQKHTTRLHT